jgi:arabinan endo-1,5-alpha-L-arabinosidase
MDVQGSCDTSRIEDQPERQQRSLGTSTSESLVSIANIWQAPDVTKVGSQYVMLYSVSSFGSQQSAIGWATSRDLQSWTDRGATGVSSDKGKPFNAIDGNLIASNDSAQYMTFGSFWQDLFIAPMTGGGAGALSKSGGEKQIAYQPAGGHEIEAPFVFNHGGKNWLFYSAGKCCALDKNRPTKGAEYRIMVCVSKGGPAGPFVDKAGKSCTQGGGTLVLPSHNWVYAPGGQGVYDDPKEGPILYYHYGESTWRFRA